VIMSFPIPVHPFLTSYEDGRKPVEQFIPQSMSITLPLSAIT